MLKHNDKRMEDLKKGIKELAKQMEEDKKGLALREKIR